MDASSAASRFREATGEGEMAALNDALRRSPNRVAIVRDLAGNADADIRWWIADAAAEILDRDAVPILVALLDDADADARLEALQSLVAIDPGAARGHVGRLRRQLRSAEFWEPVVASWALARLRDAESLPVLDALARDLDGDWRGTTARAAAYVIREDEQAILEWLKREDKISQPAAVEAARILNTPALGEALSRLDDETE